jgi:hypothetical protein
VWIAPAVAECLATAGSGDVLSGVIGAFLARGATPESALLAAVFVHGTAGESLRGPAGVTASTVMRQIPKEINALLGGDVLARRGGAGRGGERERERGFVGRGLKTVLGRVG